MNSPLTTRTKSLKPAYEKFLRAFNEACADGAIDADLARQILEEIISAADVSTLDATLKELLRIRDNLRGQAEQKFICRIDERLALCYNAVMGIEHIAKEGVYLYEPPKELFL